MRRWASALALSVSALCAPVAALALDGAAAPDGPAKLPVRPFASARQALDDGLSDLRAGDVPASLQALNYAADGGEPLAMWKLGRMYAHGENGVARDDLTAYRYFDALVRGYDEDKTDPRTLGAVANAFVAVAQYELVGIAGTDVRPDPDRALSLLQVAATNFKSTDAQYNLGRLYLDGTPLTAKDPIRAARWLMLAATKGHRGAEATFGHLLFAGLGVPVQRARGLKWEMLAKTAQSPKEDWIQDVYARDWALAGENDREMALAYAASGRSDEEMAQAAKPAGPMAMGAAAAPVGAPQPLHSEASKAAAADPN